MRHVFAITTVLALLGFATGAWADDIMLHIYHGRLDPAEVSLHVGDTVTFHNLDEMPGGHTIAAEDGSFSSPGLAKDDAWTHTFDEPGTYVVHIKEHPDAKATIKVEAKP